MYVVLIHKQTGRYRTKPGLCRGWSNWLGNAQLYPDVESALAFLPKDQHGDVEPAYVYLFDKPIPGLEWAD